MTPLANRIVKDLLRRPSARSTVDRCALLDHMDDIHCFEVSAVYELARDLLLQLDDDHERLNVMAADTSFLPAPKTWIELSIAGRRVGVLLVERGASALMRLCAVNDAGVVESIETMALIGLAAKGTDW